MYMLRSVAGCLLSEICQNLWQRTSSALTGWRFFGGVDDSDDGGAGKWVVEGGVEDMNVSVAASTVVAVVGE